MSKSINNVAHNNGLLRTYLKNLAKQSLRIFQSYCPYRTGELKSAIILEPHKENMGFDIIIDKKYMVYTNETWISPYWNGAKNKNENWFNKAFNAVCNYISSAINGDIDIPGINQYDPTNRSEIVQDWIDANYIWNGERYVKNK